MQYGKDPNSPGATSTLITVDCCTVTPDLLLLVKNNVFWGLPQAVVQPDVKMMWLRRHSARLVRNMTASEVPSNN